MNGEELADLFELLVSMLRQNELGWLVEQVLEGIEYGKASMTDVTTYKQLRTKGNEFYDVEFDTRGTQRDRVTIEEYTSREKINLLIEAVVKAAASSHEIAKAIYDFQDKENALLLRNSQFDDFSYKFRASPSRNIKFPARYEKGDDGMLETLVSQLRSLQQRINT